MAKVSAHYRTYARLLERINKDLRGKRLEKLRPEDAYNCYKKYDGRCVECGAPLSVHHGMRFVFYTPIEIGGLPHVDNLIPVCHDHAEGFSHVKEIRMAVPDINTFADKIETLFRAIINDESYKKIQIIKRHINQTLEQMAINLRYKPFSDWKPEEMEMFTENYNTAAENIEKLAEETIKDNNTSKEKKQITENFKQILTTKKYRIIRDNSLYDKNTF